MKSTGLLSQYKLGEIELKNRIVMSPMTRSRAIGNIPNGLMAEYYGQRAAAGLIITEGTSPSPNGVGYSRIPGIFTEEQVDGWKKVTSAVHTLGGKIFCQLMHTGRISHPENMAPGATIIAPSAITPAGQMWTDTKGLQDFPMPMAMTPEEIRHTIQEYAHATVNAMKSDFDGVELHGANGYLLEQFLSPVSNRRTDQYGGSIGNRCRFLLEVLEDVVGTIGKQKVGLRLSPYGIASDMPHYPEIEATYRILIGELDRREILYVHLVDHSSMGAPEVPLAIKQTLRKRFHGTVILSGGYTKERAETELRGGLANLIAFGRPFINNPDFVDRLAHGWPLAKELDTSTFYTPGEKGYTDYPKSASFSSLST
jgi:N-ethylmaleimide reductase